MGPNFTARRDAIDGRFRPPLAYLEAEDANQAPSPAAYGMTFPLTPERTRMTSIYRSQYRHYRSGAALCLAIWLGAAAAAGAASRLDEAQASLERGHWPQAYTLFATLADEGDAQAARVAFLMHRHGLLLYGQRFDADAARRLRWLDAATAASPVTAQTAR